MQSLFASQAERRFKSGAPRPGLLGSEHDVIYPSKKKYNSLLPIILYDYPTLMFYKHMYLNTVIFNSYLYIV